MRLSSDTIVMLQSFHCTLFSLRPVRGATADKQLSMIHSEKGWQKEEE